MVVTSAAKLRLRLFVVSATCIVFSCVLCILGYMVDGALGSMASTADAIDDARAVTAASAALQSLQKQLSATLRDNAYWDEAYQKIGTEKAADWAMANWGTTTSNYPLYDTAMVIDKTGRPIVAFHKGETIDDPAAFYRGSLNDILIAARRPDRSRSDLATAFIETRDGIAVIGAATIQPYRYTDDIDLSDLNILVFSKQLTKAVVSDISDTFTIQGLSLVALHPQDDILHAEMYDIKGRGIAYFTWPHIAPGTTSYLRVRPTVLAAGAILLVLLSSVAAVGFAAFKAVRKAERVSDHKAKHDALTGLWNRAGFFEQIEAALQDRSRVTRLHMIDLDGFKPVNDAWGHAVGDKLIQHTARRLCEGLPWVRAVARLGGDEFAIIESGASIAGDKTDDIVLSLLSTPFVIDGRTIEISSSVGAAETGDSVCEAAELMRRADLALYRAKDSGRGVAVHFDSSLDAEAGKIADLEQELRRALSDGDIKTVFQPLIDASTHEVRGVEALARWTSPTRGIVAPDIFVAIAEKAGLIEHLGFAVLRNAVMEAARWPDIGLAVNVSPLQLRNPCFTTQVSDILAEAGFNPARLTIEVTEGVLISSPEKVKRVFSSLRALGIKIALDDFGSGFASIGALREVGFDRMKIDRSLVHAVERGGRHAAVLQATIALANALQLPVTAEGIETEEQALMVRLSGCDELQGYLFGRPTTAEAISFRYFPAAASTG